MAPALDLRLRQHLALTPQLQQALRLLQLSALEFAQEMGEAMVQNPFLEESAAEKQQHATPSSTTLTEPTAPATAAPEAAPDQEAEERYSYESPSFGSGGSGDIENDRTDWSEPEPSLLAHLRN